MHGILLHHAISRLDRGCTTLCFPPESCTSALACSGEPGTHTPAQAEAVLNATLAALPSHGAPGRSVVLLYLTRQARLPASPPANSSQPVHV